jgi:RNA polymerase sigma factor (TIGR02999 family)
MAAPQVTEILRRVNSGDAGAEDQLYDKVYQELKKLARSLLTRERRELSLEATGLVHEVYLRLDVGQLHSSPHFYRAAAEAMRRILVDHARRQLAQKRGGRPKHEPLDTADPPAATDPLVTDPTNLLALHESLDMMSDRVERETDPHRKERLARQHDVVRLHFFAGLNWDEIAPLIGVTARQARRDWEEAKLFLSQCLAEDLAAKARPAAPGDRGAADSGAPTSFGSTGGAAKPPD